MLKRTFFWCILFLAVNTVTAQSIYNVITFGAKGDGKTDDAVAVQKAIDKCSSDGGGIVLFPRNHVFITGPVELKSNVEVHLESTATWKANPDERIYHLSAFGDNMGEGMMWIYANNADNISIIGKGTIHGNGIAFMGAELSDSYEL